MTSRHQPLHGADSVEAYVLLPFRCLIEDNDGGRVSVTVRAMGRHDARNLAFEKARDLGWDPVALLRVEEVKVAA